MVTKITASYQRRQTDKLRDGSFDGVEVGAELEFELDDDTKNPFEVWSAANARLAEAVESKIGEWSPREIVEAQAQRVAARDPGPYDAEPTVHGPENAPAAPAPKQGWMEQEIHAQTKNIQDRMSTMPGENISGGGTAIDEFNTPSTKTIKEGEAVMYRHCRVFEVEAKKASNGNPFVSLRIGKRGEEGIPGQYTTARSFEAPVIKQVAVWDAEATDEDGNVVGGYAYKIRDGDYVDVWGYFKPWKQNKDKFDLELQKVQLSEDN